MACLAALDDFRKWVCRTEFPGTSFLTAFKNGGAHPSRQSCDNVVDTQLHGRVYRL
jgi:hypothetical protein